MMTSELVSLVESKVGFFNVELSVIGIAMEIDIMLYSLVGQVCRVHDKQPRAED